MKRILAIISLLFLSSVVGSAYANNFYDHTFTLPKQTYISHWKRKDRTFYEFQPAVRVRAIDSVAAPKSLQVQAHDVLERGSDKLGLLLVDKGRIVFEEFANDGAKDTKFTSLSIAKSLTSLAVGEALCAGKIKSLDDMVSNYAPALNGTAFGKASIKNLLEMASGSDLSGVNNVDGIDWATYMEVATNKIPMIDYIKKYGGQGSKPGEEFHYNGLDTESLVLVVEGATGMPFQKWFEQTVWAKAGGASTAYWQVDKEDKVLAEAVFIATAEDYARIAEYMMDLLAGSANDPCMKQYLTTATSPLIETHQSFLGSIREYGYQFWIRKGDPWLIGYGGQMIGLDVKTQKILLTFSFGQDLDRIGIFGLFDTWVGH